MIDERISMLEEMLAEQIKLNEKLKKNIGACHQRGLAKVNLRPENQ